MTTPLKHPLEPAQERSTMQPQWMCALRLLFHCFSSAVSGEVVPCSCFRHGDHGNMRRGGHKRRFHQTLPLRQPRETLARMGSAEMSDPLRLRGDRWRPVDQGHESPSGHRAQRAVHAHLRAQRSIGSLTGRGAHRRNPGRSFCWCLGLRHLTPLVRLVSAAKTLRTEVAASPCLSTITCLLDDVSLQFEDSAVVQCAFLGETLHRHIARPSSLGQCKRRANVKACMCARVVVLIQTLCGARVLHRRVVPTDGSAAVPRPHRRTACEALAFEQCGCSQPSLPM